MVSRGVSNLSNADLFGYRYGLNFKLKGYCTHCTTSRKFFFKISQPEWAAGRHRSAERPPLAAEADSDGAVTDDAASDRGGSDSAGAQEPEPGQRAVEQQWLSGAPYPPLPGV